MNLSLTRAIVVPALLAAASGTAQAQLIAYDGFGYTPSASLNAVGNGGIGWAGPWSPSYGTNWMIDTVGSSYISQGLSLQKTGRRVTGTNCGSQRSISIGTPLGNTPGSVWVSFIAQQTSGSTAANWLGVKFPCPPASGVDQFIYIGKPYTRPAWGLDPGGFSRHRWGSASVNNKSFVVARIDFRTGPDDVRVWVNPPLSGTPANNSASVTALNVGNFEGITKAILEVGSTSGVTAGNIDELRIGRTYADVAPWVDGIMFQGRLATALGNAQITDNNGALTVSHLGSTGNDGVRIAMDSRGAELAFDVGVLGSGQQLNTTSFNALGQPLTAGSIRRNADGSLLTSADFSGISGANIQSVSIVTKDGDGNVINAFIAPGSSGTSTTPNAGPCPPGYHLSYGRRDQYTINSDGTITITTIYGFWCVPSPVFSDTFARPDLFVEFSATFTNHNNVALDTNHVTASAANIDDFTILRASSLFGNAVATGLGDTQITEPCLGGTCDNPNNRRLAVNLGGTHEDSAEGILLSPADRSPASQVTVGLDLASSFAGSFVGEITQTLDLLKADGQPAQVLATMEALPDNRLKVTLDASQLGDAHLDVAVSNNGTPVGSTSGPAASIIIYVDGMPWFTFESSFLAWNFILNFLSFDMVTPPGSPSPTYTITDVGGSVAFSGNALNIAFSNVAAVSSATDLAITSRNLTGPLSLSSANFSPATPPCPADFNQDGFLDGFDYDDFVAAFEDQGPGNPDFNQDGFVDGFDYDGFVQAFEQGC